MTVYFIHFLLLLVYVAIYTVAPRTKTTRILFISVCFLQTFLLYALRSPAVGTDTAPMAMDYVISFMNFSHKAPLYQLLRNIFQFIISQPQGYMVMCGLLIIFGTAYYIYSNSKNMILSTFLFFSLYFFFFSMNGARQSIAIILGAFSLSCIWKQQKLAAVLLLISAIGIHNTAILLTPFLALLFIHSIPRRRAFLCLYGLMLVAFTPLMHLFISVFTDYAFYITGGSAFEVGQNRKILLTVFYACVLCIGISIYYRTKRNNSGPENLQWEILLSCLFNAVIIGILALRSILFTRLEYYFSFTMILFIPLILSKFKQKNRLWINFAVYLLLAMPGIVQFMSNAGEILPYTFFWE